MFAVQLRIHTEAGIRADAHTEAGTTEGAHVGCELLHVSVQVRLVACARGMVLHLRHRDPGICDALGPVAHVCMCARKE